MQKAFRFVVDSYFVVPFLALAGALIFPEVFAPLAPYGVWFIGVIFFLSALRMDMAKVLHQFEDKKMLFLEVILMLGVYPMVTYALARYFVPDLALPLLILAAMPAGMTSPFLVELVGGRQSLALVVTVATSLLAPFTVPLMLKALAGTTVQMSFWAMVLKLAKVIFIPFFPAQLLRRLVHDAIVRTEWMYKPISVILLGLLIAGIVAEQADRVIAGLQSGDAFRTLFVIIVAFVGFHVVGYFAPFWRDRRDRITSAVCLSYMNFTLAVYLVSDGTFDADMVVVPLVLAVIPWATMFIPFKWLVARMGREA